MGDAHHCSGPPVSEMTYTVSSGTWGVAEACSLRSVLLVVHSAAVAALYNVR